MGFAGMIAKDFYLQSAVELAPKLLGKFLCRRIGGETVKLRITETEAYMPNDTACHAYRGKTPRNAVLFARGGVAYIYLCYGLHNMLNVVTGEKDSPQAVLIRGVQGCKGPGIVTKKLHIDRSLNGIALDGGEIWLEDDGAQFDYKTTARVGIDYAQADDRARLWRFVAEQ
jgi:DNA-3-methyladenine glycosylase